MTRIDQLLKEARQRLNPHEAQLLLSKVLQKPLSFLLAYGETELASSQVADFQNLLAARCQGSPIAYLLEEKEFWSLTLKVSPAVLIPRPETELLVEIALRHLPLGQAVCVADIGTGSGAIALAIASERPQAELIATDISLPALAVAKENAKRLGLEKHIEFRAGHFCEALPDQRFDAILSNPPYLPPADPHLQEGDLRFEPQNALIADHEGLAAFEVIASQARSRLKPGGFIAFEHGWNQGPSVRAILETLSYCDLETVRDLAGLERVTVGWSHQFR